MKLEDLKVGQYVRFKDIRGNTYIRNIKEVCNEQPHKSWGAIIIDKNANNVPYVSLKNIIKASYNIIDILEIGDYVKGHMVIDIIRNNRKDEPNRMIYCEYGNGLRGFYNEGIKSVITHEQIEQIAYKVGE